MLVPRIAPRACVLLGLGLSTCSCFFACLARKLHERVFIHAEMQHRRQPLARYSMLRAPISFERCIDQLNQRGDYVPFSAHNIQSDVPAKNVVAMYETTLGEPPVEKGKPRKLVR